MFTGMMMAPPEGQGGELIITPPENQGFVGSWGLSNIMSTIPSLATAAQDVDASWGALRDLDGSEKSPPQPTERSLDVGPDESNGMGLLGLSTTGLIAGGFVAVAIWAAGGNIAWALIGGVLAAILAAYIVG